MIKKYILHHDVYLLDFIYTSRMSLQKFEHFPSLMVMCFVIVVFSLLLLPDFGNFLLLGLPHPEPLQSHLFYNCLLMFFFSFLAYFS